MTVQSHLFRLFGLTIRFECLRTSSYHTCANRMTEHFHWQFKAAIMCHPDSSWLEAIPAIVLGLRVTFKPDIQATPAKLVYRKPLGLPGKFLTALPSSTVTSDPTDFVARLQHTIAALCPSPTSHQCKFVPFIFKKLATCPHALLCNDTVRRPFQPPYSEPYLVVHRHDKNFTVRMNGNDIHFPTDWLKPAYIACKEPGSTSAPTGAHLQLLTSQPASVTTQHEHHIRPTDLC